MYTLISIIFALITLMIMGEMSSDYECKMSYYIPCFIVFFMCIHQMFKAGIEWLGQDTRTYYNNYNQNKSYGNVHGRYIINGRHVYREKTHHQSNYNTYSSYQPPKFEMKEEATKKCKRNFTITIDEAKKS